MQRPCLTLSLALGLVACDRHPAGGPSADASASTPPDPATSIALARSPGAAPSARPASSAAVTLGHDLNVLLISVDSMRADMPWAGYPRAIAPHLTALEARSVSYTQAYALSSYTSQSVGGFLAGDYPGAVKRDGYFFGTYPQDVLMFPERLRSAGVRTFGAFAHGYFRKSGLEQGFDVWKMVPNLKWNAQTDENVTGEGHEKLAEEILGDPANTGTRFFGWFHFMDPHDEYKSHPDGTQWGKKARDLYDGEVEYADKYVGKLLDFVAAQPWAAKTVIIVTADHGESFGEHGVFRHGFEVFQSLVRVPWFFVVPGVAAKHIDVPRSHLDLAPTVLSLFGVPADPPLRGVDLVPEITGTAAAQARPVIVDLARTSDNDRRRALIFEGLKLIAYGDDSYYQVFDLAADPDEKTDLVKGDKERARPMIDKYKELRATITDVHPYACRTLKGAPAGRDY